MPDVIGDVAEHVAGRQRSGGGSGPRGEHPVEPAAQVAGHAEDPVVVGQALEVVDDRFA